MTDLLETHDVPANPPATDKLAGRVAFVTGGTRGIGAAISYSLANQGATVAVGYNRDRESADRFVADLLKKTGARGASASVHRGNVGSSEDCRRTIAEVIETHGRLDILINNAGITIDKPVAAMTEDDWNNVLAVNLSAHSSCHKPRWRTCSSGDPAGSSTCHRLRARSETSVRRTMQPRSRDSSG